MQHSRWQEGSLLWQPGLLLSLGHPKGRLKLQYRGLSMIQRSGHMPLQQLSLSEVSFQLWRTLLELTSLQLALPVLRSRQALATSLLIQQTRCLLLLAI